jgi:hypothetical protein
MPKRKKEIGQRGKAVKKGYILFPLPKSAMLNAQRPAKK